MTIFRVGRNLGYTPAADSKNTEIFFFAKNPLHRLA